MPEGHPTRSIFAERSYTLYYSGQFLSYLGFGLGALAIPLLVFHLTGSALSLGVTYALEFLPFALFGLVGGSLADRLDRRRLMIACDFVRFAIFTLFAVLYWRHALTLPILYTGIAISAASAAIFLGGQSTAIPFLVGKERSAKAVASLIAAEQTTNLIAPPIGGILFTLGGPLPALIANAFTYLASQLSLTLVSSMGPEEPGPLPSLTELWSDIAEGFRFLWADRVMTVVAYCSLGLNLFGMMAMTVMIPYMKLRYGATDAHVGLAFGLIALGSIAGSLLAGATARKWPFGPALLIAYAIDGLIFVPVIFAHNLWVMVLFAALASGGGTFEVTQIISWRMRIVPQEKIGRVFAAVRLVALIGVVPGTLIGGYLADAHGPLLSIIVSTFGYLIIALAAAAVPALRHDRR